jgi:aspartate/methionine/tyrosine aminotransferase
MPRSGIREIMDLAWATPDCIHLEVGEPSFATPPHIVEAAARAARDGWTKYVPNAGLPALREAIAGKVRRQNGVTADPEQVVVTAGGVQALYAAMLAVTEPGDHVLLPDPGWPNFAMIAHLLHLSPDFYPLREGHRFLPSVEDLERAVTPQTRLIVLNSPSNPLGSVIPAPLVREIAAFAERHGLWVVSDECYDAIALEPGISSMAAVGDADRVLSCFSFSKTYAMTGWRVGYVVAPAGIAPVLRKLQEPLVACVNAPAQMAALAALTGPQNVVDEMVGVYRQRRDSLKTLLEQEGIGLLPPAGAFYTWVSLDGYPGPAREFASRLLTEKHVAVVPGTAFGAEGEGWVRLSLATDTDLLLEGARRLASLLRE